MALRHNFPRCPNRVVPQFVDVTWWTVPHLILSKHPFNRVGFPQCVDSPLVGALAIVISRGVKRNMGIRQIMAKISGRPFNSRRVRERTVARRECPNQPPIGGFKFPRQDSITPLGAESAEGQSLRCHAPFQSDHVMSIEGQIVHVQIMTFRF